MKTKFCICRACGNLVGVIDDAGVPMMCCGKKMEELVPNTSQGSGEKHLPVVKTEGGKIYASVGEENHPMGEDHMVEWVYLHTDRGGHRKNLRAGDPPRVTFTPDGEKPTAVYAYCNLHGLWMTEV